MLSALPHVNPILAAQFGLGPPGDSMFIELKFDIQRLCSLLHQGQKWDDMFMTQPPAEEVCLPFLTHVYCNPANVTKDGTVRDGAPLGGSRVYLEDGRERLKRPEGVRVKDVTDACRPLMAPWEDNAYKLTKDRWIVRQNVLVWVERLVAD